MSSPCSKIVIVAIASLAAAWASADQPASITVAFSVYVAPAPEPLAAPDYGESPASIGSCDELLSGTHDPERRSCQSDLVVYTWQEAHDQTLLVISPI